jgi:hypothetical protein
LALAPGAPDDTRGLDPLCLLFHSHSFGPFAANFLGLACSLGYASNRPSRKAASYGPTNLTGRRASP